MDGANVFWTTAYKNNGGTISKYFDKNERKKDNDKKQGKEKNKEKGKDISQAWIKII